MTNSPRSFDANSEIKVVRMASFSAAHRYFSKALSNDENKKTYGSLYRDEGFGHNFLVEAHFAGPIDPMTGMIVNLADIDAWIKSSVVKVDHKDLNVVSELGGMPPTPEVLARFFFRELVGKVRSYRQPHAGKPIRLENVRVYEGDDFWADYRE